MEGAFAPVTVRITEVSAFPSADPPAGDLDRGRGSARGRLAALAAEIDRRIREAGFGPADKPWKSHLTIGRTARDRHLRLDPGWTAGLTWQAERLYDPDRRADAERPEASGPPYTPLRIASASS